MNKQTKLKILDILHEVPLSDLAQRVRDTQTDEDRYFWQSLYMLEKGQREQQAS